MKLSGYGKREWSTALLLGALLIGLCTWLKWWWVIPPVALVTLAVVAFFRDPRRFAPAEPDVMIAPADGVVSSVHEVEHYDLFGEPALCVRIFLSILDVHVTRSPCDGVVGPVTSRPGQYLNAMKPQSAEVNAWRRFPLLDAQTHRPVAAVRQVAGMIARNIVCGVEQGDVLVRGQRFGMMKFGSTAEVYVPKSHGPRAVVQKGQRVWAGRTIVMRVSRAAALGGDDARAAPEPAATGHIEAAAGGEST